MAVVAGATGPTNLWDLPTSVIILVAGFGLRGWFVGGRRGWPLVVRDRGAAGHCAGRAMPGALPAVLCYRAGHQFRVHLSVAAYADRCQYCSISG